MLDHLVGKPSANWKRTQVILTLFFGSWILKKGDARYLPRILQSLNQRSAGRSPWKIVLVSWLAYYLLQNLFLLLGMNAPEPLTRLYKRSFYRATWILTALDAGFFTAQSLKPEWLRHICSVLFSFYYLLFADAAEDKVRRVRATMSVDQMRLSWEKGAANPILAFAAKLLRPRLTIRRILKIDRPAYHKNFPPIEVYIYYAGKPDTFAKHSTVLLQYPGGGFVSMSPPCHEDAIAAWANQTGLPICSVNYRKAPEHPYPWPVEECFDLYVALVQSRGTIIGLEGQEDLKVVILGDSAGGNLTAAVTLKLLAHNEYIKTKTLHEANTATVKDCAIESDIHSLDTLLPVPTGLILIYPALDFEMTCWMTPGQLSLIRSESTTHMIRSKSLQSLLESKDHLSHASPLSVVPDVEKKSLLQRVLSLTPAKEEKKKKVASKGRNSQPTIKERVHHLSKSAWASSRLAMTSRMCFFNDRIITAEMMRAMAILYLGPHAYPDFKSDYLLSPVVAPPNLLAQFPRTYMICGEKDPFVDDTVIFGGRIRQAKQELRRKFQAEPYDPLLDENTVRVKFLEGMSHAFLQMMAFLPEAHQATRTISDWIMELAGSTTSNQPDDLSSDSSDSETVTSSSDTSITAASASTSKAAKAVATARNVVEMGAIHVAEIVTTETDMIARRKTALVSDLLTQSH